MASVPCFPGELAAVIARNALLCTVHEEEAITTWVFANARLAFTGTGLLAGMSGRNTNPLVIGFDNSPSRLRMG